MVNIELTALIISVNGSTLCCWLIDLCRNKQYKWIRMSYTLRKSNYVCKANFITLPNTRKPWPAVVCLNPHNNLCSTAMRKLTNARHLWRSNKHLPSPAKTLFTLSLWRWRRRIWRNGIVRMAPISAMVSSHFVCPWRAVVPVWPLDEHWLNRWPIDHCVCDRLDRWLIIWIGHLDRSLDRSLGGENHGAHHRVTELVIKVTAHRLISVLCNWKRWHLTGCRMF